MMTIKISLIALAAVGLFSCADASEETSVQEEHGSIGQAIVYGDAVDVSVGNTGSCAISTNGKVYCWGPVYGATVNTSGPPSSANGWYDVPTLEFGSTTDTVDTGYANSCLIALPNKEVYCWGSGAGLGIVGASTTTSPVLLSALGVGVKKIATDWFNSCAIDANSKLKCWAQNAAPVASGNTRGTYKDVDTNGNSHVCAVTTSGTVQCWGGNGLGQLGDGTTTSSTTPVNVKTSPGANLTGAVSVSLGTNYACALLSSGAVYCWGEQTDGKLGNGLNSGYSAYAVPVTDLDGSTIYKQATQLSVGDSHACVITTDNTRINSVATDYRRAKCWGFGSYGQLGSTPVAPYYQTTPAPLSHPLSGSLNWIYEDIKVSAGSYNTCAIIKATNSSNSYGQVICWGSNNVGQLGNGSTSVPAGHYATAQMP